VYLFGTVQGGAAPVRENARCQKGGEKKKRRGGEGIAKCIRPRENAQSRATLG